MSVTTVTTAELWRLSALELPQAIRSKLASSHEVIEAHLRRIRAACALRRLPEARRSRWTHGIG